MSIKIILTAVLAAEILLGCQPHDEQQLASLPIVKAIPIPEETEVSAPLPDFTGIKDTAQKKQAFFAYLRPLIDAENRRIKALIAHRDQLQQIHATHGALHPEDQDWLLRLGDTLRIKEQEPSALLSLLKRKLGLLPPALVLAQAANESAWGTSRFARQGNNLFGQWCFTPGCGLAPKRRPDGASYEVETFKSVAAGIRSYSTNLNANRSYVDFRKIRRCLQDHTQPLTGRALAAGLTAYSARGGHYVEELRTMIRINQLENWESPWWGEQATNHPCYDLVQVKIDQPDPIAPPLETADAAPAFNTLAPSTLVPTGIEFELQDGLDLGFMPNQLPAASSAVFSFSRPGGKEYSAFNRLASKRLNEPQAELPDQPEAFPVADTVEAQANDELMIQPTLEDGSDQEKQSSQPEAPLG